MLELFPYGVAAIVLAVAGLVAGPFLAMHAARRTVSQPVDMALQDEVRVLVGVLSDLRRLPYMTTLTPTDFAAAANGRIWATLLAVCEPELSALTDAAADSECAAAGAALTARAAHVHEQLLATLGSSPTRAADLARMAYLSRLSETEQPTDEDVVESGEVVLLAGGGRSLTGVSPIVASADENSVDPAVPPLVRRLATTTWVRRVLTAAALALAAALSPGLVHAAALEGAAAVVATGAVLIVVVGTIVIALVDHDTMYVDLRTMLATAALGWVGATVAMGLAGQWSRLLHGVVVVAATAVCFEVLNRVHRLLRGTEGQGGGDTLIIIVTAGLPAAITGHWILGLWSIMAAALCALVGWVVGAVRGTVTRTTPFAFGPYLAAGWVVGWTVYVAAYDFVAASWPGLA